VDINTSDTSTLTHNQISGPITRARACQLNNQVSSFLASYSSYLDNKMCILFCCLGTMNKNEMELHSRRRHLDSRTAAVCDDHPDEHVDTGDADHYESLIAQHVLSTQMERVEQNQRHIVSNKVCHQRTVVSHDH
jgi:hypothetical protein